MQCFVIGPIGEEGTDTRQNADHLFEYLIRPVLVGLNFEVVRADRLKTVASITDEIVKLIQSAELCIIDLSEQNPNVFYEAGRRHETGKPYIHLLRAGQRVPFDVQGVRYLTYKDLSSTPNVFEAQEELKQFVQLIMRSGFGAARSVNPFNNLEETLRRVEARIAEISLALNLQQVKHVESPSGVREDVSGTRFRDPRDRIVEGFKSQDYRQTERGIIELDEISVNKVEVVGFAAVLAEYGRRPAAEIILKYVSDENALRLLDDKTVARGLSALSAYYQVTGQAKIGKDRIVDLVDTIAKSASFEGYAAESKGIIANAAQRIAFATDDYATARKYAERATQWDPEEPAWYHNLSTICLEEKDNYRAATLFQKYVEIEKSLGRELTATACATGARIFVAVGQRAQALEMINALSQMDPERAREIEELLPQ